MDDYAVFSDELTRNFGPHDPEGDASYKLLHLSMKENQKIRDYLIEFNRYASQVHGIGEGALRLFFYEGLPTRIKVEITRFGKPDNLYALRDMAQEIDARYWQCKAEATREARLNPASSSAASQNTEKQPEKSLKHKSACPSYSASPKPHSGGRFSKDKSSDEKPTAKPDFVLKLGKDGKLTQEERRRRYDNKLCMVCGKPGHMARECSLSSRAKARKAKAVSPEADPDVSTETKN